MEETNIHLLDAGFSTSTNVRNGTVPPSPYDGLVPLILPCRCSSHGGGRSGNAPRNNNVVNNQFCFFNFITPSNILQSQSSHQSVCIFCSNDYEPSTAATNLAASSKKNKNNSIVQPKDCADGGQQTRRRRAIKCSSSLSLFSLPNSMLFSPQQIISTSDNGVISAYGAVQCTAAANAAPATKQQQVAASSATADEEQGKNNIRQLFSAELSQLVPPIKRTFIWLSQQCSRQQHQPVIQEALLVESAYNLTNHSSSASSSGGGLYESKSSSALCLLPARLSPSSSERTPEQLVAKEYHQSKQQLPARRSQSFMILPEAVANCPHKQTTKDTGDANKSGAKSSSYRDNTLEEPAKVAGKELQLIDGSNSLTVTTAEDGDDDKWHQNFNSFTMTNDTFHVHHHCKTIERKQKKLYNIGVRHFQKQIANCCSASTSSSSTLPLRLPTPNRVAIVTGAVKRGLRATTSVVETDIQALKWVHSERENPYTINVPVEQRLKAANHYLKRLEYHLAQIERLEDAYLVHERLSHGMRNMANAYVAVVNGNKLSCRRRRRQRLRRRCEGEKTKVDGKQQITAKTIKSSSSVQALANVRSSYKECTRIMCLLEAQLEQMIGSFEICMKGIAGFARVCSGDEYEVSVYHGSDQRWKTRGRIYSNTNNRKQQQTWRNESTTFKILLNEPIYVTAHEIQSRRGFLRWPSAGRGGGSSAASTPIGSKLCDVMKLFCPHPQLMTIPLNATGSLKVNVVVTWNPLRCCFSSGDFLPRDSGGNRPYDSTMLMFGSSSPLIGTANMELQIGGGAFASGSSGFFLSKSKKKKRNFGTGRGSSSAATSNNIYCCEPLYLLRMRWHDPISWTFLRQQNLGEQQTNLVPNGKEHCSFPLQQTSTHSKDERIYCEINTLRHFSSIPSPPTKPPLPPTKQTALMKLKSKEQLQRRTHKFNAGSADSSADDIYSSLLSKIDSITLLLSEKHPGTPVTPKEQRKRHQILENLRRQIQLTFAPQLINGHQPVDKQTALIEDDHDLIESALGTFGFLELLDDDESTTTITSSTTADEEPTIKHQQPAADSSSSNSTSSTTSTVAYCSSSASTGSESGGGALCLVSSSATTCVSATTSSSTSLRRDDLLGYAHLALVATLLNSLNFIYSFQQNRRKLSEAKAMPMATSAASEQQSRIFDELAEQTVLLRIILTLKHISAEEAIKNGCDVIQKCLQLMNDKLRPLSAASQTQLINFLSSSRETETNGETDVSAVPYGSLLVSLSTILLLSHASVEKDVDIYVVEDVIQRAVMYCGVDSSKKDAKSNRNSPSQRKFLSLLQFLLFYSRIKTKFFYDASNNDFEQEQLPTDEFADHVRELVQDFQLEAKLSSKLSAKSPSDNVGVITALQAVNGIIIPSSCVLAVYKLAVSEQNSAVQVEANHYFESIFGQHADKEVKTLAQQTILTECVFGLAELPETVRWSLLELVNSESG